MKSDNGKSVYQMYQEVRQKELEEFNEVAMLVKKYMGEWESVDNEGDYDPNDCPMVAASNPYSHVCDYYIVALKWNNHGELKLIGQEVECGGEFELFANEIEYAHLQFVTEHLYAVVAEFLKKFLMGKLNSLKCKSMQAHYYITAQTDSLYGLSQRVDFMTDHVWIDGDDIKVCHEQTEGHTFDIDDIVITDRIKFMEHCLGSL